MNEEIDDRLIELVARFVTAFETIANVAKGTYEEANRISHRVWPERTEIRQAKLTRVPTAEDKAREEQGATDTRPINEWASDISGSPEPLIGAREQQWLRDHPQEKKAGTPGTKTGGQAG